MTIATVISITGRAWARDPDGNVRELNVGDTLQENEVLVTSDNGSAQLDFGDGLDPTLVEGGEQVAMLPELDAEAPVDVPGFAAMDDDLETLLAALEDDDVDLLDVLDATAAGAGPGGAADGGHSFVRLARIAEDTDPLAFDFGMTDLGGLPEEEGGAAILAAAEEELIAPTAGSFDVSVFDAETLGETGSVASGVLPFSFGSGGAGTISFSAMDGVESQVGQENLVYSWDSGTNTLTAFSAGRELTIFTIEVDPGTGAFTLTQVNNLLHEEGMDEALTSLVYTVTSGSGAATGSLNITIFDDAPAVENVQGSEALSELALESSDAELMDPSFWYEISSGAQSGKKGDGYYDDIPQRFDDGYGNDIPYWPESPNSLDLSAFFDATIDWGADGPGALPQWHYGLSLTQQGEGAVDSGLTTGDEEIYLHVVNGMIVGSTSQTAPSVESGAEDIAFVLFIQGSQLSLVQFKAIDHPQGVNPGESISLGSDLISLTGTVTVVDADGDTATNSGVIDLGVLLGFIDDGPLVELEGATLAVEAGESIEGTWNTDPGGDVVGAAIFVSINGGEEQEVSFSDGEATFNVYLEDGETLAGTLSLKADGTWSFAAGTNLDHSDGKVPVSFELIKIDGDGDRESASHIIKIKDGAGPTPGGEGGEGGSVSLVVNERGLREDADSDKLSDSAELYFTAGSDDIVNFAFGDTDGITVTGLNGTLDWEADNDGNLIGRLEGNDVLKLSLSGGTIAAGESGSVSVMVELLSNLPHGLDLDELTLSGIEVIAIDSDGTASDPGTVEVQVDDDTPDVSLDGDKLATEGGESVTGSWSTESGADADGASREIAFNGGEPQAFEVGQTYQLDQGELTFHANGSWTFVPGTNLDHSDGKVPVSFELIKIDGDGDRESASHTIKIKDGAGPTPGGEGGEGGSVSLVVNERGLREDADSDKLSDSAELYFTAGSDDIVNFAFGDTDGITVTGLNGTLDWEADNDGNLIGRLEGNDVLKLSLSGGTIAAGDSGSVSVMVELLSNLPHGLDLDELTLSGIEVIAIDSDGTASDPGTVEVQVDDDTPDVSLDGDKLATEGGESVTGSWSTESGADADGASREIAFNGGEPQAFEVGQTYQLDQGELTFHANGSWTFVPGTNLDHSDGKVPVSFELIKIDGDGDRESASHTIKIKDGAGPTPGGEGGEGGSVSLVVNERGLREDADSDKLSDSAELYFTAGSDDIVSFAFGDTGNINVDGLDGELTWHEVGGELIGRLDGEDVLKLSLSGGTIAAGEIGSVSVMVELLSNLPHGLDLDELTLSGIEVIAVDSDGTASDPGTVGVQVDDDTPDVSLGGGKFATEGGDAVTGSWSTESGADADGASREIAFNGGEPQAFEVGQTYQLDQGELTFHADGSWTFVPGTNLDHSDGKVPVSFELIKIDGDGDRESASHTIKIKDGAGPTPGGEDGEGGSVSLVVNERGLREDADSDKLSDSAELYFTAGSDDIVSFAFGDTGNINVDGLDGELTWHEVGGELIGRLDGEDVLKLSLSGGTIAAGEIGSVSVMVELLSNLPHGLDLDELTLSGIEVIAVDSDGTASDPGTVGVQVDDDTPDVSLGGGKFATEGGDAVTGSWSTESGADADGASREIAFNGGEPQAFEVGQTYQLDQGELTFHADGSWTFVPGTNLDHSDGKVPVSFELIKIDGDGDRESASHTIKIKDGAGPTPGGEDGEGGSVSLVVNERGLREDADSDKLSDSAELYFTAGSDDIVNFAFGDTDGITVTGLNGTLDWEADNDGNLIGRLEGNDVLKLSLSGGTIAAGESGSVSVMVELLSNLPHGLDLDELTLSGIEVIAIDSDGTASDPGTVEVQVDDDTPDVSLDGDKLATEGGESVTGSWSTESGADADGASREIAFNGGEPQAFEVGQTYQLDQGELTFHANGSWTFVPGTNLDHSDGKVPVSFELIKIDGDGDRESASHTIKIKDGAGPTPGGEGGEGGSVSLVVNERGLREDADSDKLSDSAELYFTAGSDDIVNFAFGDTDGITVTGLNGTLDWEADNDGNLIGRLEGNDVLKLSLSGGTIAAGESGSVSVMVELLSNLPHGLDLDELTLSGIEVIAIDSDGTASDPGTVEVQVDDDTPDVSLDGDKLATEGGESVTGSWSTESGADADGASREIAFNGGEPQAFEVGQTYQLDQGELTFHANGSWTFVPGTNLDHSDGKVPVSFELIKIDGDGDRESASHTIKIKDGAGPTPGGEGGEGGSVSLVVNERGLREDADSDKLSDSAELYFTAGSDDIVNFAFGDTDGITVTGLNGTLDWEADNDGNLIGRLEGNDVLKLSLSGGTIAAGESGSVSVMVELLSNLPHGLDLDELTLSGIEVIAIDSDGTASDPGKVEVQVDDDTPDVSLGGGKFATEGGDAVTGSWSTESGADADGASREIAFNGGEPQAFEVGQTYQLDQGELTFHADGSWTFVPGTNLDHSDGKVPVSFELIKIDGDGDRESASHTIKIKDGAGPTPGGEGGEGGSVSLVVNERGLREDADSDKLSDSAELYFTAGSDDIVSFAFGDTGNINVDGLDGELTWHEVGGELIGRLDGEDVLKLSLSGGTIAAGEIGSVSVMVELLSNLPHGLDLDELTLSGIEVIAIDSDGTASDPGTVGVTVDDDMPSNFTPDTAQLEDGFSGNINFAEVAGADGVGNVIFTVEEGSPATDREGNSLFLDGEPLYYSYDDGDQSVLLAKTADGELGFKITLNSESDTYDIEVFGTILNGTEFQVSTTEDGVSGSNTAVYGFNVDDGIDNNDVLVSTISGSTVNNSTGRQIGIGQGQSIAEGEVVRFDFVSGLNVDGGDNAASWDANLGVSRYAQEVTRVGGGGGSNPPTSMTLTAFSGVIATSIENNGGIVGTPEGGEVIPLTASDIRVFDSNAADITSDIEIVEAGGSVTLVGMKAGYTFEVSSDTPFEALEVKGADQGSNFNLGNFTFVQGGTATDIELELPLQGIDGDGDTADGSMSVEAPEPDQLYVGGNSDTTFESGGGDDVLIGDVGGGKTIIQPGQNYNVSIIVDVSGSMDVSSGTPGLTLMELTKQALVNLSGQLEQHDGTVNVQLVPFSSHASSSVEINNLNSDNIQDLLDAIDALQAGGGTNYMAAFQESVAWFNSQAGQPDSGDFKNVNYFLTDGDPTYYYDENGSLQGSGHSTDYATLYASIQAFSELSDISSVYGIGMGHDVSENYLRFFDNTDVIGEGTETFSDGGMYGSDSQATGPVGTPDIVQTAEQLQAALQGGSEHNEFSDLGDDVLSGGEGNDILFGDTVNSDHLSWTNGEGEHFAAGDHDGMGYLGLIEYLRWNEDLGNNGNMPTEDQVITYIRENWEELAQPQESATPGNNDLYGGAGDDILIGGSGNDTLRGGEGNDTLFGGLGADTFVWKLGDQGEAGDAFTDTVVDFDSNDGDVIDLSDLLQERDSDSDISSYLRMEDDGQGGTVIHISTSGAFEHGYDADLADQHIVLKGVAYNEGLLEDMLNEGYINIDQ